MKYFQAVLFPDSHSLSHVVLTWPGFIPCPAAGLSIPCSHPFSCSQHLGCAGLPWFPSPWSTGCPPCLPCRGVCSPCSQKGCLDILAQLDPELPTPSWAPLKSQGDFEAIPAFPDGFLLFLSVAAESFWFDFATWWEKPEHPNSSTGRSLAQSSWI